MAEKTLTKWRLTDKNIPVSERTFDTREEAEAYLALAWMVYPNMQRARLSRFDITTEVVRRPIKQEVPHDGPGLARQE
jgi:hypothetical protein